MTDVLNRIYARSRADLLARITADHRREIIARAKDSAPTRDFASVLRHVNRLAIIAEIKFQSPSAGILREKKEVEFIAQAYAANGADALSVLTEPHEFTGHLEFIVRAKNSCPLPILRKDFLFDDYQIFESRAAGADAVLLIAAMLEQKQLFDLCAQAHAIGLAVLLELHDEADLLKCDKVTNVVWGVNHRNLSTLKVDMSISKQLLSRLPRSDIKVAESGIKSRVDIAEMRSRGADAVLVGTSLMRAADPGIALSDLLK